MPRRFHPNIVKYKNIPPSKELVKECLQKAGLGYRNFSKAFGVPMSCIAQLVFDCKSWRYREMPAKYWHIFYEFDSFPPEYKERKIRHQTKPRQKRKRVPNDDVLQSLL